jgi:hypothetical protein
MVHKIHQQRLVKVGNRLTLIVPKWFYDIYLEVRDEMDKSIDLGKLQIELKACERTYEAQVNYHVALQRKAELATTASDAQRKKAQDAKIRLDRAKDAVLEAARTVTQG